MFLIYQAFTFLDGYNIKKYLRLQTNLHLMHVRAYAPGIDVIDTTLTNGKGYRTDHSGAINNETAAATDLESKGASDIDASNGAGSRASAAGIDVVDTTLTNGNGYKTDHSGAINNANFRCSCNAL